MVVHDYHFLFVLDKNIIVMEFIIFSTIQSNMKLSKVMASDTQWNRCSEAYLQGSAPRCPLPFSSSLPFFQVPLYEVQKLRKKAIRIISLLLLPGTVKLDSYKNGQNIWLNRLKDQFIFKIKNWKIKKLNK